MVNTLLINKPSSTASRRGEKRALPRVLCIVGPTASGKTALGIELAKKFNGEIINADARQVYRYFEIGTSKPSVGKQGIYQGRKVFMVDGIPHYLMDVLPPTKAYTVAAWRKKALQHIKDIAQREHLPMIVGGTGLYIQALIENYRIPSVAPQPVYRAAMEGKPLAELVELLQHADPEAAKVVDLKNRRRVIRALEVMTFTGKSFVHGRMKMQPVIDACLIGMKRSRDELYDRISDAVENMVKRGWEDEIKRLRARGIPWDAPAMTSLGYREMAAYVRGECSLERAKELIKRVTRQYAKRQMTWFKRDSNIHWVKDAEEAEEVVREWMK